jgi:hypothetical protein
MRQWPKRHYWLTQDDDGTEFMHFEPPPAGVRAQLVTLEGRWEVCTTRNAERWNGATALYWPVPPLGADWQICDDRADKRTTWRRQRL